MYTLTNDNVVNILYGSASNTYAGAVKPDYNLSLDSTIILGYVYHQKTGSTYNLEYFPVNLGSTGYVALGGTVGYETVITDSSDSLGTYMNIEFKGTSGKTGTYDDYNYLSTLHAF